LLAIRKVRPPVPDIPRQCYTSATPVEVDAMAEIFGAVATAISLIDITIKSSKRLYSLQSDFRNAPSLIKALSKNTKQLRVALTQLDDTRKASEAAGHNTADGAALLAALEVHLGHAQTILDDFDLLTQELAGETIKTRVKWYVQTGVVHAGPFQAEELCA
jgi:hypothetical protein